jgi:predicted GNAT superfamily acetyltransferase
MRLKARPRNDRFPQSHGRMQRSIEQLHQTCKTLWLLANPADSRWPELVDTLWARLRPASHPLLPSYFVKTTFVKMGGQLVYTPDGAVGLLFPRALTAGERTYTLRLHGSGDLSALAGLLAPDRFVLHDPLQEAYHSYHAAHQRVAGLDLGTPGQHELTAIRTLYVAVWGDDGDSCYPDDLHSSEFAPATSLVARDEGQMMGFLLGFYRFGLAPLAQLDLPWRTDLAIESQIMAVTPAARRSGLAVALKRLQAQQAITAGLDLIHWTADPLQFANAALNLGRLRAVSGEHYVGYYPFRNALNLVTASRLGLVWLPRSRHGRAGLSGDTPVRQNRRADFPGCVTLNSGPSLLDAPIDANPPWLAIEIPADWNGLQRSDLTAALDWRGTTDALLGRYLGFAPGRYLLTDVAAEGERRFLIARRFHPELLMA